MKTYTVIDIQKVYKQHHKKPNSVVYSEDNGYTWKSVPIDSGKWNLCQYEANQTKPWLFAFIK